jgi:hypothetical protein
MGPASIYPWKKMHRSRAPSIAPGTFFVAQPSADCITNMPGFNLRQAQPLVPSRRRRQRRPRRPGYNFRRLIRWLWLLLRQILTALVPEPLINQI